MHNTSDTSLAIRIVRKFLDTNLSILLMVLSVVVGGMALWLTPREEEPQIVVPLADVFVNVPGRSAAEIEQLVSSRLEKLMYQIDGVEYVYSMSRPGQSIVTVRFYVGQDREKSLVKLYNKIQQNIDYVPIGVSDWVVKPIEIDDVPVVTLALTSAKSDDAQLRRVAEELAERLQRVSDTSLTNIVGGRPREMRIDLKPESLAAYSVSVNRIAEVLKAANISTRAGDFSRQDRQYIVDAGEFFRSADELRQIVVATADGKPIYLRDVATVTDGPADLTSYVRFGTGPAWGKVEPEEHPAGSVVGETSSQIDTNQSQASVTIAISKKKGTNAVWVARDVMAEVQKLRESIVPADMSLIVTRNMGVTANHKVNELIEALVVAILIVIALLTIALGTREAFIVAVAVPIVFALTLLVNMLFGYTINRVTLFALILALGLLVDDPIVDVENIHRHFHERKRASRKIVLEAVNEVRPPLIAATLAVIFSFLPMLFITGMMGPYMRPMALNVPVTMLMSMLVSFTITPWLTYHLLRKTVGSGHLPVAGGEEHAESHEPTDVTKSLIYRAFYPLMAPLLHKRWMAWTFMGVILLLLGLTGLMPMLRQVPLKMLPFDNKNELQLVIDMPENATLERTEAAVRAMEDYLRTVPEVVAFESYAGLPSPIDFNGLVRHYYLRRGSHQGELRLVLADKKTRQQQSHGLALRLRKDLTDVATKLGARLKIVESPPGPPVVSTIVAEIYGREDQTQDELRQAARIVAGRLRQEAGVVDVDTTVETPITRAVFAIDRTKAAVSGVSETELTQTLSAALGGQTVTAAEAPGDRAGVPIVLRMPEAQRSSLADLSRLYVQSKNGGVIPLAELGTWKMSESEQTIYHKNLRPVQYVFAECAGRAPAECILDVQADQEVPVVSGQLPVIADSSPKAMEGRTFLKNGGGVPWSLPAGATVTFSGEGEWKITLDVFRDLGLAFAGALVAIYILLVHEMGSFLMPLVVMLAIPLTILGIMPGFWLLNHLGIRTIDGWADPVFFTATGMIGMIALAGIVTRDSIILVDFIHHSLARGKSLFEAIMESRVVRLRPIILTSLSAMLGAWPITLDPIFSGLAWALIFGLLASTVFTLFVIPVAYWLLYANVPGHGLSQVNEDE